MGPRGVGQDEGGDGERQEDGAARSLGAQERRKRLRQPVDDLTGQPVEPRIGSPNLIHADFIRSSEPQRLSRMVNSMMSAVQSLLCCAGSAQTRP